MGGIVLALVVPFAGLMSIFAHDDPSVSAPVGVLRSILLITIELVPIIWLVALILFIVEVKHRRRKVWLEWYEFAPFAVLGVHILAWAALSVAA